MLVVLGPGHDVAALSPGLELVAWEGHRERLRTPPALELARVRPEVPEALGCGVEVGDHRHRQVLYIGAAGDGCHVPASSSARISAIFVALLIHSCSKAASNVAALRIVSGLAATRCSLPLLCLRTSAARSSTATCFCTAVRLIS